MCSNSERGLLGVAVDPDFRDAGRKYVYLYYTFDNSDACSEPVNRVSWFTMSDNMLEPGKFTVNLTVRDNLGKASAASAVAVYPGDTPPRPVIVTPTVGTTFHVGQSFTATVRLLMPRTMGMGMRRPRRR